MPKTAIWVIVILVVLVGGYFLLSGGKSEPAMEEGPEMTEKKMAFSDFIKNPGGSYRCDVKMALSDFENSGVVYISGNMLRGEFTTVAEGMEVTTYIINRDGYTYTWSSATPGTGYKIMVAGESGSPDAPPAGTYSWDASQIGDYNCVEWQVDASVFAVPTNVTFQEIEPK